MKTPKRHYKTPATQLAQDIEPDFFESDYHTQEARWKRKNKIAQLKRTIARLKRELAVFLEDGRYELIIEALKTLSEHGDAKVKRACLNALVDFAK